MRKTAINTVADLCYTVSDNPVYDHNGNVIRNRKALWANNQLLSVVSDRYQTVQNVELLSKIPGNFTFVSGYIDNYGKNMMASFALNLDSVMINNEHLRAVVTVYNSFDGTSRYIYRSGFYRLICSNGAIAPFGFIKETANRHISGKARILSDLEFDIKSIESNIALFKDMANYKIDDNDFEIVANYLLEKDMISATALREITQIYTQATDLKIDRSLWELYNAFTAYATHGTRTIGRTNEILNIANFVASYGARQVGIPYTELSELARSH